MNRTGLQVGTWLIRRAHLMDPSSGVSAVQDLVVEGGRVAALAEEMPPAEAAGRFGVIEAEGLWLWPGLVDVHVHFREPGFAQKETISSGGAAAARGGYTTVVCEPNTSPPIDSPELARRLAEKAEVESPVRIYFKAAMTAGREGRWPSDIEALAKEPSVVALSDDGDPVTDPSVMQGVCRAAARAGMLLSPHCEDSPRALSEYEEGRDPGFEPGEPYESETRFIERDLALARRLGCRVHFSHVSLASSVELLRRFREEGGGAGTATFELTPHHLLLSRADFGAGELPRVTPPLRSPADRGALQAALTGGAADAVASDHAPHTPEDKARGASGLIGLETTLGLVLTYFVHTGRLSPLAAARAMSTRPAEVFGLPAGSLMVGRAADMVFIDPDERWKVRADEFASLSRNTPYEGWRLRGRAVGVMVGGRMAFAGDSFRPRLNLKQEVAGG